MLNGKDHAVDEGKDCEKGREGGREGKRRSDNPSTADDAMLLTSRIIAGMKGRVVPCSKKRIRHCKLRGVREGKDRERRGTHQVVETEETHHRVFRRLVLLVKRRGRGVRGRGGGRECRGRGKRHDGVEEILEQPLLRRRRELEYLSECVLSDHVGSWNQGGARKGRRKTAASSRKLHCCPSNT